MLKWSGTVNRVERRALQSRQRKHIRQYGAELQPISESEWPPSDYQVIGVWVSRKYLVQAYDEGDGVVRLSVNRSTIDAKGNYPDGLSWDELQKIKRDVGYGDRFAVEIYPRDEDVVNVANMRHLWVLESPLNIGWRKGEMA